MKTPSAPPYLLPPEDCVVDHPWTLVDGQPLPGRLEHWDPFTDTEVIRTVEVDLDALREACQLGSDATFGIAASWFSSRSRFTGSSDTIELGHLAGQVRAPVSLVVPGAQAGGRLDLRTRLIVRYSGAAPSVISPRREGAVLWSQETRVALEGGSSRFPVTAVDFTAVPRLPDGGSWALEWNAEELDAPVLGGLRLIVNSQDEALVNALRHWDVGSALAVVRSFVLFDVARTLVESALRSERFVSDPESFDEGSVGRMLFELLTLCWPGLPVGALVRRSQDDPGRLAAELQAHLGVLR